MFKWLWDNIFCWHHWKDTGSKGRLTDEGDVVGDWYMQQCSKCNLRRIEKVRT